MTKLRSAQPVKFLSMLKIDLLGRAGSRLKFSFKYCTFEGFFYIFSQKKINFLYVSVSTKKWINIKVRKISILSKYAVLVYLVLRAKSGSVELHYSLHEYESIVPNFCRNDELSLSLS